MTILTKKYPAKNVAYWFIKKANEEDIRMDNLKLMKLVYISQGFALAATGKRLFAESVEAWKYGPVISSIYHQFKHLGMSQITSKDIDSSSFTPFDDGAEKILQATWKTFKKYSGIKLSNWTHLPDSPWYQEWEKQDAKKRRNHPIDDKLIADYFKQFLAIR